MNKINYNQPSVRAYIPTRKEFDEFCNSLGWKFKEEVWIEMVRAHFLTKKGKIPKSWQILAIAYNGVILDRHRKMGENVCSVKPRNVNYDEERKFALGIAEKLFDARLLKFPKYSDTITFDSLVTLIGRSVVNLCKNDCFLEDFLHILETSDGTPKSHKERGV